MEQQERDAVLFLMCMELAACLMVLWWACGVVLEWVFGERGR